MSAGSPNSIEEIQPDVAPAPEQPPIPMAVVHRERAVAAILAVVVTVVGAVAWWSIPSDELLFERASQHPDMETRIGAMNSLVLRGYWHERPPAELAKFLKTSPPPVRQFIADMHGGLLRR